MRSASKSTDAIVTTISRKSTKVEDPVIVGPEDDPQSSNPLPSDESADEEPSVQPGKINRRWSFKPALARLNPGHPDRAPILTGDKEQRKPFEARISPR